MNYIMKKWEVEAVEKLVEMTAEMGRLHGENESLKKENAFLKELLITKETTIATNRTTQPEQ